MEGSSANDFKQQDNESVNITTPFNAALTEDDTFASPAPPVVDIKERVEVTVQKAIDDGTYIETRSAPLSMPTQELVRSCYLHLWQKMRDDGVSVSLGDLEKHVRWECEISWGPLRKTWGISQLDGVLRDYGTQFTMAVLEANKAVGECKIAAHPYMLVGGSNPRTSISVSLVDYVADPIAVANTMDQISGSQTQPLPTV